MPLSPKFLEQELQARQKKARQQINTFYSQIVAAIDRAIEKQAKTWGGGYFHTTIRPYDIIATSPTPDFILALMERLSSDYESLGWEVSYHSNAVDYTRDFIFISYNPNPPSAEEQAEIDKFFESLGN